MQFTSWARNLALAAGEADREAVVRNFSGEAKSRAHHFARRLGVQGVWGGDSGTGAAGDSDSSHYGNKCRVTMAITSQILDENTHTRSHNPNRKKSLEDSAASDHNKSEDSLSKRAKGFIPGSQDGENPVNPNMAGVISGMGSPNVGRRLGRAVC